MADLLNTVSSFLKKLKWRTHFGAPSTPKETTSLQKNEISLQEREANLRNLSEPQLQDFVSQQPERALVRILQSLTDQSLQLRIIETITQEAALKRIGRSELSKKLKRAAEKRIRKTDSESLQLRVQKFSLLNTQLQAFLDTPQWLSAREFLAASFDPALMEFSLEESHPTFAHFQTLRNRLKAETEGYEKICREMEEICKQLNPSNSLAPTEVARLRKHWNELKVKYSFPKNLEIFQKYELTLKAKVAPSLPAAIPEKAPEKREQAQRQRRLETVESILRGLHSVSKNVKHREAGPRLRRMQKDAAELKRWRTEYPTQMDEVEALLKELLAKRTEAASDAQWEEWARTDQSARIQTELETLITALEAETDPELLLKNALGLARRIFEGTEEIERSARLLRAKDPKALETFKALSDRGWIICDRLRAVLLESLKTTISAHASTPVEFIIAALFNPRATINLRNSAFDDTVSSQVKELRMRWTEIGAKPSESNREGDMVFTKLYEMYFRQLNLHLSQVRRLETFQIQKKQDLLHEMKIACEGKSSLLARTRVAKGLEEKWNKVPIQKAAAPELQVEFEGYQDRLNAELAAETLRLVEQAASIQTQAQAVLDKIQEKKGAHLPQALKTCATLEAEFQLLEKNLTPLKGLKQITSVSTASHPAEATDSVESRFQEIRSRLSTILQGVRAQAAQETAERVEERNRVIFEAEELALSTNWEASLARFEELKTLWKTIGVLGQSRDAIFEILFENIRQFHSSRAECREQTSAPEKPERKEEAQKLRNELLCSLEALIRLRESKAGPSLSPLPFTEAEQAQFVGKTLEFGMKYRQILLLDPKDGVLKETKKIMASWSHQGMPDEARLTPLWKAYLERIHSLLEIQLKP